MGRVETVISGEKWQVTVCNLLHLIEEATPPSINPKLWVILLEALSTKPQIREAIRSEWKIRSWLLERWGSVAPSISNSRVQLWFPSQWLELWCFLALPCSRYRVVILICVQACTIAVQA